ncbi:hypothetical protein CHS0354_021190 [Potamilus streckersoni]|uniref:C-type lectin domain-containing protein n=1 Tax=Potamilus streckersoni TaxID=2493646 RepID=A0AAE0W044_9BIVA|nr:hypothetical protein CHS0354_021190 [Potamilus streckersoni]
MIFSLTLLILFHQSFCQVGIGEDIARCPVCHSGYEYYQQDKFCYKFYNVCQTWSEARQVCQNEGGDLISLNNRNLNFFNELALHKSGSCDDVWVGATDVSSEGQWNWLNGDKVSSDLWAINQPDNWDSIEHCGDLHKRFDYELNDADCSRNKHFICQVAIGSFYRFLD